LSFVCQRFYFVAVSSKVAIMAAKFDDIEKKGTPLCDLWENENPNKWQKGKTKKGRNELWN